MKNLPGISDMFNRKKQRDTQDVIEAAAENMQQNVQKETAENSGAKIRTYLKSFLLHNTSDLNSIKNEISAGNILILRITPLADKSIEDVKQTINELCEFVTSFGGDIARLGSERVVICPQNVKIWREKKALAKEPITTTT